MPPPLQLRSRRWGLLKPLMKNWLVGKLSSSFLSEIIRVSILFLIWCDSNSNLFLRELIFKCPILSLFRILTLRDLNSALILNFVYMIFNFRYIFLIQQTLHKKWRFLLRISSVIVTKSLGNWGSGYIYWRNL